MKILFRFTFLALAILIFQSEITPIFPTNEISITKTLQTKTFKVLGNCGMCKRTIEKAAITAGASKAVWSWESHLIVVTFDAEKTSVDAIQREIAKIGYDNDGYKATDEVYNKLHGCCQYDRTGKDDGQKSCSQRLLENAEKKKE
jgi:periplasmic mercuric ion binding protein